MVRAIRGATTAENTKNSMLAAARELVAEMIIKNGLKIDDLVAIIFSLTSDFTAAFPTAAVREMGITNVPLIDVAQPDIDGALDHCIRVMMLTNTEKTLDEINHLYLRGAKVLRPDLVEDED